MTTKGLKEDSFIEIANIIDDALNKRDSIDNLKIRVSNIIKKCD